MRDTGYGMRDTGYEMRDTGYIDFCPGSRIPNHTSIGVEEAQPIINADFQASFLARERSELARRARQGDLFAVENLEAI